MSAEQVSNLKFEIGHVLFIDIVGYSKLLINEQSEQMQKLREIVRVFRSLITWGIYNLCQSQTRYLASFQIPSVQFSRRKIHLRF